LTAAIVWRWGPEPTGGAIRIPELSAEAQAGKRAFDLSCARCHGENAGGSAAGPPLVHRTYQTAHHAGVAFELAVRQGVRAHHWRFGDMPSDIYWEWWTAENSDGFHNPAMARESLARSITVSQDGIKALDEALAKTRAK